MKLLAIDIGSSSVKAAVMNGGKLVGRVSRAEFQTRYADDRAEIDPATVLSAINKAIRQLGQVAKTVDLIAPAVMAPSWLAMDRNGRAITPVITHQDRRSIAIAKEIERRIGKGRHLNISGNRPFPGGISSTTAAWYIRHEPGLMKRAALIGHFSTFLLHQWTGERVTDTSSASFTGFYNTTTLDGWSEELCDVIGVSTNQMPRVQDANVIAGPLKPLPASRLGLRAGTPVLTGCIDTSAAMFALGAKAGQVLNVCGSTDVLAVCTSRPHPHERLLTRALGVGRRWMSVSTLAAGGSSLTWVHRTLFADKSESQFYALLKRLPAADLSVQFDPYLAGERTSIEQKHAAFIGLSLSTTRKKMLTAVVNALARASADRLPLLRQVAKMNRNVVVSGGSAAGGLSRILHRDWGHGWRFQNREELTARGLFQLAEMATPSRQFH